jgi:hypothetical protein
MTLRLVMLVITGKRHSFHLLRMSKNMTNGKHWALMWSAVFSRTKTCPDTGPFLVIDDLTLCGHMTSFPSVLRRAQPRHDHVVWKPTFWKESLVLGMQEG